LDHLPGPDAHDLIFSVSSVAQTEGQLLETVYDEGPQDGGFGRLLEGYMVPINCEVSGAKCGPATLEEKSAIKTMNDGGLLSLTRSDGTNALSDKDTPLEYLLAHFGTKVLAPDQSLPIVRAQPPEACDTIANDVKGKIVLVRRGGCPFVQKAETVQSAGGSVMIVGSLHPYIVRMGVEPRWKGLNTAIPVVMVSQRAYSILLAESLSGATLGTFQESSSVNGSVWEGIEKLANAEGWPRSAIYVSKKYDELKDTHSDWPDRLTSIEMGYKAVEGKLKDKSEL